MDGPIQTVDQRTSGSRNRVRAFEYPACGLAEPAAEWNGWSDAQEADDDSENGTCEGGQGAAGRDGKQREERGRGFEAGRERGREEGRAMEREAHAAVRKSDEERNKRQLAKLVLDFGMERDRFLQSVEHEVVKLALAVSARILRREAQMDPLLLTGAVRVALGQLAGTTEMQLKVPAAQLELWREAIGLIPNLAMKPNLVAGEGMRIGDCLIESKVGSVDLGIRSQLCEIERGFFDRAIAATDEGKAASASSAAQSEAMA
jgi:flagellar assembly protein FliH